MQSQSDKSDSERIEMTNLDEMYRWLAERGLTDVKILAVRPNKVILSMSREQLLAWHAKLEAYYQGLEPGEEMLG